MVILLTLDYPTQISRALDYSTLNISNIANRPFVITKD